MADIAISPEALQANIASALGEQAQRVDVALGEVTVTVSPDHYHAAMKTLRDAPGCQFEQLLDLCGIDYSTYGDGRWAGPRFAVVSPGLTSNSITATSLKSPISGTLTCTSLMSGLRYSATRRKSASNWAR